MKKVLLLLICFGYAVCSIAQNSVTLKGPYKPNSRYLETITNTTQMKFVYKADTATLNLLKSKGINNPVTMQSEAELQSVVTTGRVGGSGGFPMVFDVTHTVESTPQKGKFFMYAQCHPDSLPIFDSIAIEPKTLESSQTSSLVFNLFKSVFNGITRYPQKNFHLNDTATIVYLTPVLINGIELNIKNKCIFQLMRLENGLAYFNVNIGMDINFLGQEDMILSGSGTGSGNGKYVYDIRSACFKTMNTQVNFNANIKIYNALENKQLEIEFNQDFGSQAIINKTN